MTSPASLWSDYATTYAIAGEGHTGPFASLLAHLALVTVSEHNGGDAPGPLKVLDVATGVGAAAEAVLLRAPDATVHASDFAPGMVELCAKRLALFGERATASVADGTALPDEWTSSFDLVVSNFGIMLMPDRTKALEQALKVLRPGGWCAVTVWDMVPNEQDLDVLGLATGLKQLALSYTQDDSESDAPSGFAAKARAMDSGSLVECFKAAGFSTIMSRDVRSTVMMGNEEDTIKGFATNPFFGEPFKHVNNSEELWRRFVADGSKLLHEVMGQDSPPFTGTRKVTVILAQKAA